MYKGKLKGHTKKNSPTIGVGQGRTRKDLLFRVPMERRSVNWKHGVDQRTNSLVGGPESRSQLLSYRTLQQDSPLLEKFEELLGFRSQQRRVVPVPELEWKRHHEVGTRGLIAPSEPGGFRFV